MGTDQHPDQVQASVENIIKIAAAQQQQVLQAKQKKLRENKLNKKKRRRTGGKPKKPFKIPRRNHSITSGQVIVKYDSEGKKIHGRMRIKEDG